MCYREPEQTPGKIMSTGPLGLCTLYINLKYIMAMKIKQLYESDIYRAQPIFLRTPNLGVSLNVTIYG